MPFLLLSIPQFISFGLQKIMPEKRKCMSNKKTKKTLLDALLNSTSFIYQSGKSIHISYIHCCRYTYSSIVFQFRKSHSVWGSLSLLKVKLSATFRTFHNSIAFLFRYSFYYFFPYVSDCRSVLS